MHFSLVRPLESTAVTIRCHKLSSPQALAECLPALGNVLYLPMQSSCCGDDRLPVGLVAGALCLAPLLQVHGLLAASAIEVEGPREWIECLDRAGRTRARLYLLPDTDYCAWDALLDCGVPTPVETLASRSLRPTTGQAMLLRFRLSRFAGLRLLQAESAVQASMLSQQLAEQMTRTRFTLERD